MVRHSSTTWGDRAAASQAPQVPEEDMVARRRWPQAQSPSPYSRAHLNEGLPPSEGFQTPTAQAEREILWGLLKTK